MITRTSRRLTQRSFAPTGRVRSFAASTPQTNFWIDELPMGARYRVPQHGKAFVLGEGEEPAHREAHGISVAVIGASGVMGRSISAALARDLRRLGGYSHATIQLVGSRFGHVPGILVGLCTEYKDAWEEVCPSFDVCLDVDAVKADIIIMCAGATLSENFQSEAEVTQANIKIFQDVAEGIRAKNPESIILVVSNPMELGIQAFLDAGFASRQVIGTGAYLQTMRFRREVASGLGLPRQHVSGLVLGRHGLGMVPIWSSVHLASHVETPELREKLDKLKEDGLARLPLDENILRPLARQIKKLTSDGEALAAGRVLNQQPAEYRTALRRYMTFFSGPPFARIGNAEVVCQLVGGILGANPIETAAHIQLHGEYLGMTGAVGVPVVISGRGVKVNPVELDPAEEAALKISFEAAQGMQQAASQIKMLRKLRYSRPSWDLPD